ncbi:MAG TPA: thiamine pyrophosphate-binding protein [Steroidobacteraceae bacterium]|jgi:acetolactate synthase-1/2/3 large subunit
MGNEITGGELVVRTLAKAGVRQAFGLHGAHLETLFQACQRHDIKLIDTRHEVAAGHAAEGFARAARKLGVAMVTAGPGFTNVITSMANAHLDRTPVLYLSGAAALRDAETNTLQAGIDQVAIARPLMKWAHQITTPDQIPRLVAQAIRIATSGPTGPVLLDLPADVLGAKIDADSVKIPESIYADAPIAPHGDLVYAAMEMLLKARRPVIMVGAGAWQSGCEEELRTFADEAAIPVYSDFQAHGLLPSSHPLYGGTFHKMADLTGSERPDVVLALGVRFGLFTLGSSDRLVPRTAKLIHVEIDPKEIGRLRDVALGIVSDSRQMLTALVAHADGVRWPDTRSWVQHIQALKHKRLENQVAQMSPTSPPIHPCQLVKALVEGIDEETLIVADGAETYHWLNEVVHQNLPGSYITHGFLGAVGFGMGLALGAQTAFPNRRVLCLVGDGAFGFTMAELDTMSRHGLPIVVVIMNNRSWAASQHFQEIVSGPSKVTGTRLSDARYHDVAKALGCYSKHVTRVEELKPALQEALASGRPACLNVEVDLAPLPPELHLLMERHS